MLVNKDEYQRETFNNKVTRSTALNGSQLAKMKKSIPDMSMP